MGLSSRGARIRPKDLEELNQASEDLAAAARVVQRANAAWADAVVELLIRANNRIVAIMNRGGEAYRRYLEKHGGGATSEPSQGENSTAEPTSGQTEPPRGSEGS